MATVASTGLRPETRPWSPARLYLVISGTFLVVVAGLGFLFDASFPTAADQVGREGSAHILGIFETNGWHNLNGVISGLLALGFATRPGWARLGALFKGWLYVAVTASIAIWGPETFLIASNAADQVLHGSLAVTGLVAGYATPRALRVGREQPV
jgi:hypothetical protein